MSLKNPIIMLSVALLATGLLALLVRLGPLQGQSLWVDEVFSLAIATGHSLEHPAAVAVPELGDYVEFPEPVSAARLAQFTEHRDKGTGPRRLVRALLLSDRSPPLYYFLLALWTRAWGTGDAALRAFSVVCSVASLPVLSWLAHTIAGRGAVLPALVMFSLSPAAVYYGTEGRMYALLMFFAIAHGALAMRLQQSSDRQTLFLLLWSVSGAAGLLTHYFFLFVWLPMALWLALHWRPRKLSPLMASLLLTLGLVLPWYRLIPFQYSNWLVTAGWLDGYPERRDAILAPFRLLWSYFYVYDTESWRQRLLLAIFVILLVVLGIRIWKKGFEPWFQLLALWLVAAIGGLVALDILQETRTSLIRRYALAGLPAAVLLAATASSRLRASCRAALCSALAVCWIPQLLEINTMDHREGRPLSQMAEIVDEWALAEDLVIIQSIPSGVIGITRYLSGPAAVVSWVEQLGVRSQDLECVVEGYGRIVLAEVHVGWVPRTPSQWLHENATLERQWRKANGRVRSFVPTSGSAFAGISDSVCQMVSPTNHSSLNFSRQPNSREP